jgi:hypothetical protein
VRTLRLLLRPEVGGPGLLALTVNGVRSVYWLAELESPAGGRVFELGTIRGRDTYHLRLAQDGHTCDCWAGAYQPPQA